MIMPPIACAAIGALLPFTPLAHLLGFASLPLEFFLILVGMIAAYLVLVEVAKARFYKVQSRPHAERPTGAGRHERHVRRRAARFRRGAPAVHAARTALPQRP